MSDTSETSSTEFLIQREELNLTLDEADDLNEENEFQVKSRIRKVYVIFKTYENLETARKAIESKQVEESEWGKTDFRETKSEGKKQYYKCTQCDKAFYIKYHKNDFKVTILVEDKSHDHVGTSSYFINKPTKEKVLSLIEDGVTPKQIIAYLQEHPEYTVLTAVQINNLMQRSGNKKKKMSLYDAEEWCNENSQITEDPDKVFVVPLDYNRNLPNDANQYFHIFGTTKRLLKCAIERPEFITTDGT